MDPPPPPPPPPSLSYSSSILAMSVVGIVATAVLLLAFSLFLTKCCFHFPRRPSHLLLLLRFSSSHHRSPSPVTNANPAGLSLSSIRSLPTLRFSRSSQSQPPVLDCAVCLADFREHDLLRVLPSCSHSFHIDCIDTWLQSHPNCPLCRSLITPFPLPLHQLIPPQPTTTPSPDSGSHVVIEVRDVDNERTGNPINNGRPKEEGGRRRKFWEVASMGDECIDHVREKDERFAVAKPMRRSFSMDSSSDRQLYLSVQEILRQRNPGLFPDFVVGSGSGEGSSSNNGRGVRRSFFSFGHGRSSRSAVLPVEDDLL